MLATSAADGLETDCHFVAERQELPLPYQLVFGHVHEERFFFFTNDQDYYWFSTRSWYPNRIERRTQKHDNTWVVLVYEGLRPFMRRGKKISPWQERETERETEREREYYEREKEERKKLCSGFTRLLLCVRLLSNCRKQKSGKKSKDERRNQRES